MSHPRTTDQWSAGVLAELVDREPLFHHAELGTERADFDAMMDPEFWEIGASGRRYSREQVLDVLEQRHREPVEEAWKVVEPRCQQLAADVFLLTYRLTLDGRITQRSTIWHRCPAGWQAVFHQGTVVAS
jgi:hypothetical protein